MTDQDTSERVASGGVQRNSSRVTPDLKQLKALAHPVRTKMLGLLRIDGPATATQLAQRLDLNSGATSYHLRQLAQNGLVVEDETRGNNRDRWWKAAHQGTSGWSVGDDEESQQVVNAYQQAVGVAQLELLTGSFRERHELPGQWADVVVASDWSLWLTPEQAEVLTDILHEVVSEVANRVPANRDEASDDAEQYMIQLHGFPRPGQLAHRAD